MHCSPNPPSPPGGKYVFYRPDLFQEEGLKYFSVDDKAEAKRYAKNLHLVECCDYKGSRIIMAFDRKAIANKKLGVFYYKDNDYCFDPQVKQQCDDGDIKSIWWRLQILEAVRKMNDDQLNQLAPVLKEQKHLFLSKGELLDRFKIATCSTKGECKAKVEKFLLSMENKIKESVKEHLDPLREMKHLLGITEKYVLYRPDLEVDTKGEKLELRRVYDYFETEKELNDAVSNLTQIACLETGSNASAGSPTSNMPYQSNQHAYPANHSNPYASQANYSNPYASQANHYNPYASQANYYNPHSNPAKNVPKRILIAVGNRVKADLPALQQCQKVSDDVMEKFFDMYELRFKAIRYLRKVKGKCEKVSMINPKANAILKNVELGKDDPTKKRISFKCKDPVELNMYKTLWTHGDFLDRFGWIELDNKRRIFSKSPTYSVVKSGLFQSDFKSFNYEQLKQKYESIIKEVETWLETK